MTGIRKTNYQTFLDSLTEQIRAWHRPDAIPENALLTKPGKPFLPALYWTIGDLILKQPIPADRRTKILTVISKDLRLAFKDMKCFSSRNLRLMCDFASAYPVDSQQILQGIFLRLSWSHHISLLRRIQDPKTRLFYLQKTAENGWSRAVLVQQIEAGLCQREGRLFTNFKTTLPPGQYDFVQRIFKDLYTFDFIQLDVHAKERDIETALTSQIKKFLHELGQGFAFLGNQYKVCFGEKEYFYDMLLYHTSLKCHIVIEVKMGEFKPEDLGKMILYLEMADKTLKHHNDEKSIGLLLCRSKNALVADCTLRNALLPIGIAEYKIRSSP